MTEEIATLFRILKIFILRRNKISLKKKKEKKKISLNSLCVCNTMLLPVPQFSLAGLDGP